VGEGQFADDRQVLCARAPAVGGQGWDEHEPAQDADADQEQARLLPYFNAWCWGHVAGPLAAGPAAVVGLGLHQRRGGGFRMGLEHSNPRDIRGGFLAVMPDASRSQNIGELEAGPAPRSLSRSGRPSRSSSTGRVLTTGCSSMTEDTLLHTDPVEVLDRLWSGWRGHTAYDVGAHKGENIPLLEAAGFTRIVALEPEWASFAELVRRFGDRCHAWQAAASDHHGWLDLAEVPMAISKGELVTPGTTGMEWSPADWAAARIIRTVPCITLDGLAGSPDFVVVDTEGHEARVLAGAREILQEAKAGWLIEFHAPDLKDRCERQLEAAGYTVEVVRHPHYPPHSHLWYQHGWLRARKH
jgi:FkbM family methyltransferase